MVFTSYTYKNEFIERILLIDKKPVLSYYSQSELIDKGPKRKRHHMSKPVTPDEWKLALMNGYATILRSEENYAPQVGSSITNLLLLADNLCRLWEERNKSISDTEFQQNISQEMMKAEGILNSLALLGRIPIEGHTKFPLSLAYKWHEGWYGFIASLYTNL